MLTALLTLLLLLQPAGASGQEEIERLERERAEAEDRAAEARAEADALAEEIAGLQERLVAAGRRAEASERSALASEARIAELAAEEWAILARLDADRETLTSVLMALQRIEMASPPALAAAPGDAAEAARAAALMAEIAPALRARAAALAEELESLRIVREAAERERGALGGAEAALDAQRREIEALLTERRTLETRRRDEARRFAETAARAGAEALNLRELVAALRRAETVEPRLHPRRVTGDEDGIPEPVLRPSSSELVAALRPEEPLETLRFADARGLLRPPAAGSLHRRFGQRDAQGEVLQGVLIRTRARAQVTAPFDGRVEYAGGFGAYGGLLILNVGDDYYIVLAGMAAVYAEAGRAVLAGEPVGAMPDRGEPAPELYLEIRRGDAAVDPEPWLRPDARAG
ncbi:MAG: peptidoglycan DD-metalloendopeptidase family protein [Maricaulaceae bacterium]|nr:peptidoglycan DD-metalloendopeptidase family protein [Maricaulaceae bacterium]